MPRPSPIEDRLLRHLVLDGSCWAWTGKINKRTGYGSMTVANQAKALVHRVAYETWVGPIPEGLTIDHLCGNKRCINYAHLEPVTRRENILRSNNMAARHARQTHCKYGHPLSGDNLGLNYRPDGRVWRFCLTCRRCNRKAVA